MSEKKTRSLSVSTASPVSSNVSSPILNNQVRPLSPQSIEPMAITNNVNINSNSSSSSGGGLLLNSSGSSSYQIPSHLQQQQQQQQHLHQPNYSSTLNHSSISSNELFNSMANRILHGKYYKVFYTLMAAMSFVCLVTSLSASCPAPWFYILEFAVLVSMCLEFLVRYFALGGPTKSYWRSLANVVDAGVVLLCLITFSVMLSHSCGEESASREAIFEESLLLVRNGIQLFRLVVMMQKNSQHLKSTRRIDLNDHTSSGNQLLGGQQDEDGHSLYVMEGGGLEDEYF